MMWHDASIGKDGEVGGYYNLVASHGRGPTTSSIANGFNTYAFVIHDKGVIRYKSRVPGLVFALHACNILRLM